MGLPLSQRKCLTCEGGIAPLPASAAAVLLQELQGWELVGGTAIRKTVTCKSFLDAVGVIGKIAPVAEAEDHHPDLHLTNYKTLTIELSTHAIRGLSENDFILAAKLDQVLGKPANPLTRQP